MVKEKSVSDTKVINVERLTIDFWSCPDLQLGPLLRFRNFAIALIRRGLEKSPRCKGFVKNILSCGIFRNRTTEVFLSQNSRLPLWLHEYKASLFFRFGFFGRAAMNLRRINHRKEPSGKLLYKECLAWTLAGQSALAAETARRALRKFPENENILRIFLHLHKDVAQVSPGVKALMSANRCQYFLLAADLLEKNSMGHDAAKRLLDFAKSQTQYAELIADYLLWYLNKREEACEAFDIALKRKETKALYLKRAMAIAAVQKNTEDLKRARKEILDNLKRSKNIHLNSEDNSSYTDTISEMPLMKEYCFLDNLYHLAYQCESDVEIMRRRSEAFYHNFPDLKYISPHISSQKYNKDHRKIRIGFFVELFHSVIWEYWGHILASLPRDVFQVIIFAPEGMPPSYQKVWRSFCDEFVTYPYSYSHVAVPVSKEFGFSAFPKTREIVAAAELDILHLTLVGQSPLFQYLAYARLAPVQMVDGGRITTTGMPEIDYYLQNEGHFIGDPAYYFTERLALIEGQTPFFKNIMERQETLPEYKLTRKKLRWPKDSHIYLGMQGIGKRHPEMDVLFARILIEDPKAVLVLTHNVSSPGLWDDLIDNLKEFGVKEAAQRLLKAPHCDSHPPAFAKALVNLADVCLSYRRFGGGITFNQLLAYGVPQIIWPDKSFPGGLCANIYRQIGMDELIVDTADAYVTRNIQIASEKRYRSELKRKFRSRVRKFYENLSQTDFMGSFSWFLEEAVLRERSGLPPAHWHRGKFYERLTEDDMKSFATLTRLQN